MSLDSSNLESELILGVAVHQIDYGQAVEQIVQLGRNDFGGYICAANVHMLMEVWDSPEYREIIKSANIVAPDGMPLVWMMRLKGVKRQTRVYGPTLMLHVLERAARDGIPVGFYGSDSVTLASLVKHMEVRFADLRVVYAYSPPFRRLSDEENEQIISEVTNSGARILFVGLGCPGQETWMNEHYEKLNIALLGVGAAFDFHAGNKKQAPEWMQKIGLEWFFRLIQEPKRLARRYLYHNPRFIVLAVADLFGLFKINLRL